MGVNGADGKVLRYDASLGFSNPLAWEEYDVGSVPGVSKGFGGAVFAANELGAYVYFVPYHTTTEAHGRVLRYNTDAPFDEVSSWEVFDIRGNCGSIECTHGCGFHGGVLTSTHIYFVPHRKEGGGDNAHGEVCRYDLSEPFSQTMSWQCFDYNASDECTADPSCRAMGYVGGCFDGRYVYFSPESDASFPTSEKRHGEFMRYDTTGDFLSASSWTTFDPGAEGYDALGYDLDGYVGCACDRGYAYFSPANNAEGTSGRHGNVVRLDTDGDFDSLSSWSAYDIESPAPVGANGGFGGIIKLHHHVYFIPYTSDSGRDGLVPRFNTLCEDLDDPTCWETYDYGADPAGCAVDPLCNDPDGFHGAATDGRYVYFAQMHDGTAYAGEIMRFDGGDPVPAVATWGVAVMAVVVLAVSAIVLGRRRATAS